MVKMHYFLYTNAPNVYSDCRAVWTSRKEAREALVNMHSLGYFTLYRGYWVGGVLPRPTDLTHVRIHTVLAEAEKRAK